MCIPCNSARRAIESAMNKNPDSKRAKDDMKKTIYPFGRKRSGHFEFVMMVSVVFQTRHRGQLASPIGSRTCQPS